MTHLYSLAIYQQMTIDSCLAVYQQSMYWIYMCANLCVNKLSVESNKSQATFSLQQKKKKAKILFLLRTEITAVTVDAHVQGDQSMSCYNKNPIASPHLYHNTANVPRKGNSSYDYFISTLLHIDKTVSRDVLGGLALDFSTDQPTITYFFLSNLCC